MNGVLVDSDILIEVLRQRHAAIMDAWVELASSGQPVYYSPVSVAEIRHGMREPESRPIEHLFSTLTSVPIGDEIGQAAGDYLRAFHKSHAVEMADALIAATASAYGLALWTQNRKHFPMRTVRFFGEQQLQ